MGIIALLVRARFRTTRLLKNHDIHRRQADNWDFCRTSDWDIGLPHSRRIPPFCRSGYLIPCSTGAVPRRSGSPFAKPGFFLRHELLQWIEELLLPMEQSRGPAWFCFDRCACMPELLRSTRGLARIACGHPGSRQDGRRPGRTKRIPSGLLGPIK
jgi:hypothetical protein